MANTATAIYVDTYGSGTKQEGHPEFELSEAILDQAFTVELWYKFSYVGWTDWAPLINISNTEIGSSPASSATGDTYFMAQYGGGNNYYAFHIYSGTGVGGGEINSAAVDIGNIIRNTSWNHVAFVKQYNGYCSIYHNGELLMGSNTEETISRSMPGRRVELGYNRVDTGNYPFKGWMDEVRISKTARYGNIDTPTERVKNWQLAGRGRNEIRPEHVKLLLQAKDNLAPHDSSGRGKTFANGSSATLSSTQTKFGDVSFYSTMASGAANEWNVTWSTGEGVDFATALGDFSWEMWMWLEGTGTSWPVMFGTDGTTNNTAGFGGFYAAYDGTGYFRYTIATPSGININYLGNDLPKKQWCHIASCRVQGVFAGFINGKLVGALGHYRTTSLRTDISSNGLRIPWTGGGDGGSMYFDDFRVCVGQSAYTPHFNAYGVQKNVSTWRGGEVTDERLPGANSHSLVMGRAAIGSTVATNANTYCLDLNGTSDYFIHNRPEWYTVLPESHDRGTVFAWIYPDSGTNDVIIASCDHGSADYMWILYIDGSGKLRIETDDATNARDYATSASVGTGGWHSVAWVSTGSAWTVYIDGTAAAFNNPSGTNVGTWLGDIANRDSVTIGAVKYSSTTNYFDGKIMQVAYWGGSSGTTGVLDADAIAALHSAGKGHDMTANTGNYDSWTGDLRGYWKMGNHYLDTPTSIYDASGNNWDMRAVGVHGAKTWSTGTTFLTNWQHRGYFTPDKYTSLLIQSSTSNNSTTITDTGPGFKKMFFDGSADHCAGTNIDYRSSDTAGSIVAWIKKTDNSGTQGIFSATDGTAARYVYFYTSSNTLVFAQKNNDTVDSITSVGEPYITVGSWHCVAITSDGSGYKLYINGTLVPNTKTEPLVATSSGDWFADTTLTSGKISIGSFFYSSTTDYFDGQIAQVGIWSSELSASQISAISSGDVGLDWTTSYSAGMADYWTFGNKTTNGTDTISTIYSQGGGGNNLTAVSMSSAPYESLAISQVSAGTTYHSPIKSVFGGSSLKFPGTSNQELTLPDDPAWYFGTGDYTIEMWHHGTATGANKTMISWFKSTSGPFIELDSGNYTVYKFADGSGHINVGFYRQNTWNHIAATRQDGIFRFYINGVETYTNPNTTDWNEAIMGGGVVNIGTIDDSNDYFITGYLDEIRVSSGIARYGPSLTRYANTYVEKGDTGDYNTILQIQSNGAKEGATYADYLNQTGRTTLQGGITGSLIWSSAVGDPFGGTNTALYFNGSSYLEFSDHADWDWAATDYWCLDVWINPDFEQYAGVTGFFLANHGGHAGTSDLAGWSIDFDAVRADPTGGSTLRWQSGTGSPRRNSALTTEDGIRLRDGVWSHLAFQKTPSCIEVFHDGVCIQQENVAALTGASSSSDTLRIGHNHAAGAGGYIGFVGYMADFRISKGVRRYGDFSLRTKQMIVTSSNSDSGVIASNSTFGTSTNGWSADPNTLILLTGLGDSGTNNYWNASDNGSFNDLTGKTVYNRGSSPGTPVVLRQGVSAFGANSYSFGGTWESYLEVSAHSSFTEDIGTGDYTMECWFLTSAAQDDWSAILDHRAESGSSPAWMGLGCLSFTTAHYPRWHGYPDNAIGGDADQGDLDHHYNQWNHIAFQRRGGMGEILWNGEIIASGPHTADVSKSIPFIIGDSNHGNRAGATGEDFGGFIDSVRVSNVARYGYSQGTNTKLGLNAVHPSHCKLLFYSNTFSGNTHFDDFSDQGNYWNQQPSSYFFDGTNDSITSSGGITSYNALANHYMTINAWVKPYFADRGTHAMYVSAAAISSGTSFQYYLYTHSGNSVGSFIEGPSPSLDMKTGSDLSAYNYDGWNMFTYSINGEDDAKYYVNGVLWNTDTNYGSSIGANSSGLVVGASVQATQWALCQIAQVGVWEGSSSGHPLSAANIQSMWEAGPTANWMTNYSDDMHCYLAMGNHNDLGGRPADTASVCYDRSGNGNDGTTAGSMTAPSKGEGFELTGSIRHSNAVTNFGSSAIKFAKTEKIELPGFYNRYMSNSNHNWTLEAWVYFSDASGTQTHANIFNSSNDHNFYVRWKKADKRFEFVGSTNGTSWNIDRYAQDDTSVDNTWYHIALQYDGGNRESRGFTLFQDGVVAASYESGSNLVSESGNLRIGTDAFGSSAYWWSGYMDEIAFYTTNKYMPIATPGKTSVKPSSELSDPSGNHFKPYAGTHLPDQFIDTPENNFCIMNPIDRNDHGMAQTVVHSAGVKIAGASASHDAWNGSLGFSTGKWYWEGKSVDSSGGVSSMTGIRGNGYYDNTALHDHAGDHVLWSGNESRIWIGGTDYTSWGGYVDNDWIGVAVNMDEDSISFYKNGAFFKKIPNLTESSRGVTLPWRPCYNAHSTTWYINFGQGDYEGENNYTDDNGIGGFRFKPPAGHLALCTANMSDEDFASIGPNSIKGTSDQHFDTVLWTGDGKVNRRVGGLKFQPDLIWIKNRDNGSYNHHIVDSVRGPAERIISNSSAAGAASQIESINPDGFTLKADRTVNETDDYVAWCWKAGNDTVVNTDGDLPTTISVNQDAGFSIISYDNRAPSSLTNYTLGHGLTKAPEFVLVKNRGKSSQFAAWHKHLTADYYLAISDKDAQTSYSGYFPSGGMTATTIKLGNDDDVAGQTNGPCIMYAWHGVQGYSMFGTYKSDDTPDGPFVYTGFKPAFIIIKNITTGNAYTSWGLFDRKRQPDNPADYQKVLWANLSSAEGDRGNDGSASSANQLDFLSNGFKIRGESYEVNSNGVDQMIFAAWAEMPLKYARGG